MLAANTGRDAEHVFESPCERLLRSEAMIESDIKKALWRACELFHRPGQAAAAHIVHHRLAEGSAEYSLKMPHRHACVFRDAVGAHFLTEMGLDEGNGTLELPQVAGHAADASLPWLSVLMDRA